MLIDHMKADLREQQKSLERVQLLKDIEADPTKIGIYVGQEVALMHSISNLKVYIAALPGEIAVHVSKRETDFRIGQAKETAV
ncbi:hypothetical protein [Sporolactobacillus terrae]|uniref:hypothetical protein n=1 Tax=Sporolactobacillus terrae TaxID=269673 RepID=UPI00048B206E|nr:hypothetical protein [Sporolactobacillus terrae]